MIEMLKRLLAYPLYSRQKSLQVQRSYDEEAEFTAELKKWGVSQRIGEEVYRALSKKAFIQPFAPRADDDLGQVFGLIEEELDEVTMSIFERCGFSLPRPEEVAGEPPVRTARDLAKFAAKFGGAQRGEV